MDFIVDIPKNLRKYDSFGSLLIADIADYVSSLYFDKSWLYAAKFSKIYIKKIISLHCVLVLFVLDKGTQFISNFWEIFQSGLSSKLDMNTTFHTRINGQSKYGPT